MSNCCFERVSRFRDADFDMPRRKTANSAGYDMVVAEDIIIPSYHTLMDDLVHYNGIGSTPIELNDISKRTKEHNLKPTLVSTGVKCIMPDNYYLQLSVRSSCPLKHWLIMANGVGIIDADYASQTNPNEGEIFFQLINLSPWPIQLKKGDIIGQGILMEYKTTNDDNAFGNRIGGFGSTN